MSYLVAVAWGFIVWCSMCDVRDSLCTVLGEGCVRNYQCTFLVLGMRLGCRFGCKFGVYDWGVGLGCRLWCKIDTLILLLKIKIFFNSIILKKLII